MGHCVAAWELTSSFASLTVMFLLLTVMSRTEPGVPHKKTDIATSQMSRNRKSHIPDSHSDHEICCRCVCVWVFLMFLVPCGAATSKEDEAARLLIFLGFWLGFLASQGSDPRTSLH